MSTLPLVGGALEAPVTQSYNSFGGADYQCFIGPYKFTELQGLSYSVSREKAPIYTMGSADPRAFARNKRGIGGSLVWINFDRHALLQLFYQARGKFVSNVDDIRPSYSNPDLVGSASAIFNSSLVRNLGPTLGAGTTVDQLDVAGPAWVELATPYYSDQILPFDIVMGAANEYGAMAGAKIFGVEILNEATGVSIDDTVTETQASFVARAIEPLQAMQSPFSAGALGATL